MLKKIFFGFVILSFLMVSMGCAEWSRTTKGAAIGAGAGGAAGALIGYLGTQNVDPARIATEGYGKSHPIASNDTAEGRAQNRRVEVAIWANEKLKKVAKEKTS